MKDCPGEMKPFVSRQKMLDEEVVFDDMPSPARRQILSIYFKLFCKTNVKDRPPFFAFN